MNKPLCGSNLNGEMLEEVFVAAGKATRGSLQTVSAEKIVHPGGFTSDIYRVFLTWKGQGKDEAPPSRILVKIAKQEHFDSLMEIYGVKTTREIQKAVNVDNLAQTECNVYRMLSKEAPPIPIPKCYPIWTKEENSPTVIAMEDLSPYAKTPDLALGLTRGQLISCAEAIAALQAWSLNTHYEWKKEVLKLEEYMDAFLPIIGSVGNLLESSVKQYPAYLKCVNVEKTRSILGNKEKIIAAMTEHRTLVPDVIVHGDLWGNNILFHLDGEEKSISDRVAAIIDWQGCHEGSFVEDLCGLYASSVNPDVRRCTMKEVFRHYFDKLRTLAPKVMSSVSFERAYGAFEKTLSLYGMLFAALANQFSRLVLRDNPTVEAALMSRIEGNYKDAANYFNI